MATTSNSSDITARELLDILYRSPLASIPATLALLLICLIVISGVHMLLTPIFLRLERRLSKNQFQDNFQLYRVFFTLIATVGIGIGFFVLVFHHPLPFCKLFHIEVLPCASFFTVLAVYFFLIMILLLCPVIVLLFLRFVNHNCCAKRNRRRPRFTVKRD